MTNSICLSSDMNTLFLIDNGRAIAFDLNNANGILVGVVKGQLVAVTAIRPLDEQLGQDKINSLSFPIKDSQYTMMYNEDNNVVFFIGATEIDGSLTVGQAPAVKIESLNLGEQAIHIRKKGSDIIIQRAKSS